MTYDTRIFSFGLGQSPSRSLVKGLARATNGHFIFIPPNTSVDEAVCEQLRKALQPCISNMCVKWNLGVEVQNAPRRLPPVYINDRLITYGLISDQTIPFDHNASVELELQSSHRQLARAKVNRVPTVSHNKSIARLAAKALILELQHGKAMQNEAKSIKQQIVDLSLKYGVLSPYTAFIGIEKRTDANNDSMVLREVPIQISADAQDEKSIISIAAHHSSKSFSFLH